MLAKHYPFFMVKRKGKNEYYQNIRSSYICHIN